MSESNKISVLLPSRDRPAQLVSSVQRLVGRAENPSRLEILLRLDLDDEASLRAYRRLCLAKLAVVRAVVGERYDGWRSNHLYYNALASEATGGWLFLYNDDALMLTKHWDTRLLAVRKPIAATRMLTRLAGPPYRWQAKNGQTMGNCFPAVRRDAYELLGQFSRHRHVDVYWEWLTGPLGLQEPVEIDIFHIPTSSVSPDNRRGAGRTRSRLSARLAHRSCSSGTGKSQSRKRAPWWDDFNSLPLRDLLESDRQKLRQAYCE